MKKNIIMVSLLTLPFFVNAQTAATGLITHNITPASFMGDIPSNGIFLNADEFENGIPEMGFDKKSKDNHIREFDDKLIIIENTEKTKFTKSDIWGFRKNNQDYRIYNNDDYAIAYAPKGLSVIFYKLGETTGEGNIKDVFADNYYFSRNSQSDIYPLTASNIKEVFSDQIPFVEALNKVKLSDEMPIHEIDKVLSEYVKNHVN
ncbi:hypothetical protein [Emticicia sp. BO119]|uniref:hypothetical protein n=1 Tax=Emticicia sp. BO119 TaxID=2757768 RepID=UPI0015F089D9|nr:hypothetical protein [Emticicia sp. BO119]MBA4853785.1 hypothetical protein [Emticicia sp. BO119]